MSVAELGIKVTSKGLLLTNKELERLGHVAPKADNKVNKLNRSSKVLTRTMRGLGAVIGLSVGVALFGVVRTLSSFESGMSKVAAVTRASTVELAAMRDVAKELGSTTEFTAAQAASGLSFLGMAGFSAAESIAAIPAVLDLATAATMDLGTAADISSNIMSAFSIAATDASSVTDVLAAASSRANTDVRQLGDAMKFVGPIASALDISVNDAAAAIGVLSDAGLQGTMAGTGLRRVLSSLVNPTDDAKDSLKSLGVELKDVNPEVNSLVDIVDVLSKSGLGAADALTIFGDRGGPAILALTSQSGKLRELTGELNGVEGAAKTMADTMRDNLGGDITIFKSAVSGLIIALGEAGLTDALRGVFQAMTNGIRILTEFGEGVETLAYSAGVLATFMGVKVVGAFALAKISTITLTGAMIALRTAIILTGIGALVIGAGYLINKFVELTEKTGGVGEALGLVKTLFWEFALAASASVEWLGLSIERMTLQMRINWRKHLGEMGNDWADMMENIAGLAKHIPGMGGVIASAEFKLAAKLIRDGANNAGGAVATLNAEMTNLTTEIGYYSDVMRKPLSTLKTMKDVLNDVYGQDTGTMISGTSDLLADLSDKADDTTKATEDLGEEVETLADKFKNRLTLAIDDVSNAFGDWMDRGFKDFGSFARSMVDIFKRMIVDMIMIAAKNKILVSMGLGGVTGGLGGAGGAAGGLLAAVGSGLGGVGAGVASGFASGGIGGALSGGAAAIGSGVSGGIAAGGLAGIGSAIGAALPVIGIVMALFAIFKKKPAYKEKDFNAIQAAISLTNAELLNTNTAGQHAATGLKKLVGGMDNLNSLTQSYYSNFFTQEEQRLKSIEGINGVFASLNMETPETASQFRSIVEAQDLMTVSGRETYAAMLQVSAAFADVYGGANSVNQAMAVMTGSQGVFATLQDEIFANAAQSNGYMTKIATTRENDSDEVKVLLREIVTAVRSGNINLSRNTAQTVALLERQELEPAV